MKVIFLDIDGVMVTGSYLVKSSAHEGYQFTPRCVEYLKEIIEQTGAYIVVSSTWRRAGFNRLKKIFQPYGLVSHLIGQTPINDRGTRGDEIKQYIEESYLVPSLTVKKFVILDDHDNMGELSPYLIQTDWSKGLDVHQMEAAIKMLAE